MKSLSARLIVAAALAVPTLVSFHSAKADQPIAASWVREVDCSSVNFQDHYCSTGMRQVYSVQLEYQFSSNACVYGQTYGATRSGMYVAGGCRGRFLIRGR